MAPRAVKLERQQIAICTKPIDYDAQYASALSSNDWIGFTTPPQIKFGIHPCGIMARWLIEGQPRCNGHACREALEILSAEQP